MSKVLELNKYFIDRYTEKKIIDDIYELIKDKYLPIEEYYKMFQINYNDYNKNNNLGNLGNLKDYITLYNIIDDQSKELLLKVLCSNYINIILLITQSTQDLRDLKLSNFLFYSEIKKSIQQIIKLNKDIIKKYYKNNDIIYSFAGFSTVMHKKNKLKNKTFISTSTKKLF
jgi:hypothetical protein